jgi:hypothetical protein
MDLPGEHGFVVLNTSNKTLFVVMPQQRLALDLSDTLSGGAAGVKSPVTASFSREGGGPAIAGYRTYRYSYSVQGNRCGTLFASPEALEHAGMRDLFAMMERMAAQAQVVMNTFDTSTDPCRQADHHLGSKLQEIGAPMRVLDAGGKRVSEITRIDRDAELPANAFTIPADYRVQNASQMLQLLPGVQQFLRQVRPPGQ